MMFVCGGTSPFVLCGVNGVSCATSPLQYGVSFQEFYSHFLCVFDLPSPLPVYVQVLCTVPESRSPSCHCCVYLRLFVFFGGGCLFVIA